MTTSSPGVQVTVTDASQYPATSATTVPLYILATRANKLNSTGTGIAAGTQEANVLRAVTSQRETNLTLGLPAFVTSSGAAVHGHECNEYGLHALWQNSSICPLSYYVRADLDLGQLMPTDTAPTNPVADGTYWIQKNAVVGGFYRRNAADSGWDAVPSSIYTTTPGSSDGAVGDIAFDYSTTAGTLKIKTTSTVWSNLGSTTLSSVAINSRTSTAAAMWISDTAPTGAGANDYWWKTSAVSGGYDLKLKKYRASDATWVEVIPTRSLIEPTSKASSVVWEDLSSFSSNGSHPLKVGNGTTFVALTTVLADTAPTLSAATGDYWYSDDLTDFALYLEATNEWTDITTVTSETPAADEKVISATAPTTPDTGAIWVDTSIANLDNYPVIKRWNGTSWENITASVTMGAYVSPTLVPNGTYWINFDDPRTKCTVKVYDPDYQPVVVNSATGLKYTYDATRDGHWKPAAGVNFGRKAQRFVVVAALKESIAVTENLRSEAFDYKIIVASAYPELYSDMLALNADIDYRAEILPDVPFTMIPSGVATGREITVTDWKTNVRGAAETGEAGFAAAGTPYGAMYYPHGLTTNADGLSVMVPSSTMTVRTMMLGDQNNGVYHSIMGMEAGLISNASSVGYLKNDGTFKVVNLEAGQSALVYDNNINPIQNIYRYGLRIMGNKSLYGDSTMLSKANVGRLVSEMKSQMKVSFRAFLGKPNDAQTWASVRNVATRYMAGKVAQRAVSDFVVICDENNNGPSFDPAGEQIFVDIAFVPVGAVEFITVRLEVDSPGTL